MSFQGRVENGIVVTDQPLPLPNGTTVRVEPIPPPGDFWHSASLDELAAAQGISRVVSFDELIGGWPEDEVADDFDLALAQWRAIKSEGRS